MCFQVKHLGQLMLIHARPPGGSGKSQQQVTPCCKAQRKPPANLTCCLKNSAAYGAWIQDVVDESLRCVQPSDCYPQMLFLGSNKGARWRLSVMTKELWGPRWCSQSCLLERLKGVKRRGLIPHAAEQMLGTSFSFYDTGSYLRISIWDRQDAPHEAGQNYH